MEQNRAFLLKSKGIASGSGVAFHVPHHAPGGVFRVVDGVNHRQGAMNHVPCGEHAGMITQFVTRDMDKKHFRTKAELNDCLRALKKSGPNAYLFKASRIMTLETCIKEVFPAHYFLLNLPNFNQLKNAGFKLSSVSQHIRRRLDSSK